MSFRRIVVVAIALWLNYIPTAMSQDAVPVEILQRTYEIRASGQQGTAFTIDYKGKIYIVTARHIAAASPLSNATIQLLHSGNWEDVHTIRTLFPPSPDVDIAVYETDQLAPQPYSVAIMTGKEGPTFGQQVWFLGYPFMEGIHTHFKELDIPFIKRGTMSAIDNTNPNAILFYIDGFNNSGFSGGPVIFWDFKAHIYRIMGVVRGYRSENAQVIVNGQRLDTPLLVNSGILIGYSIEHATQAIETSKEHQR